MYEKANAVVIYALFYSHLTLSTLFPQQIFKNVKEQSTGHADEDMDIDSEMDEDELLGWQTSGLETVAGDFGLKVSRYVHKHLQIFSIITLIKLLKCLPCVLDKTLLLAKLNSDEFSPQRRVYAHLKNWDSLNHASKVEKTYSRDRPSEETMAGWLGHTCALDAYRTLSLANVNVLRHAPFVIMLSYYTHVAWHGQRRGKLTSLSVVSR